MESCSSGDEDHDHDIDNQGHVVPHVNFMSSGDNVLINILCKREKGQENLSRIIEEITNFGLSVDNLCSLPFGDHLLNITIITLKPADGLDPELKNLGTTVEALLLE